MLDQQVLEGNPFASLRGRKGFGVDVAHRHRSAGLQKMTWPLPRQWCALAVHMHTEPQREVLGVVFKKKKL